MIGRLVSFWDCLFLISGTVKFPGCSINLVSIVSYSAIGLGDKAFGKTPTILKAQSYRLTQ